MNDTMKYIRKHYPNNYLIIEKLYVLQSEITYRFERLREMCYLFSVRFQGKPFNIMVIQVYAPTSNAEEAEVERFYEDLQDFLELTPPKRCPFHHRGLECKSTESGNTWSNRLIWPWSTE